MAKIRESDDDLQRAIGSLADKEAVSFIIAKCSPIVLTRIECPLRIMVRDWDGDHAVLVDAQLKATVTDVAFYIGEPACRIPRISAAEIAYVRRIFVRVDVYGDRSPSSSFVL
jgi:hypothetical protein